jgi:hypothetical protein
MVILDHLFSFPSTLLITKIAPNNIANVNANTIANNLNITLNTFNLQLFYIKPLSHLTQILSR